ncbi:MAG: discoidin domain-containing protein, partial [Phycisphaeraceae bacterium]|nr:discoidin domain-containing protein [Phycisphaeraceae bacterium]
MNSRLSYSSLIFVLVISGGLMANPLRQDLGADGIVSVEAENYDANVEVGGHTWEETGPVDGFTGVLGMHAPNGRGGHSSNYAANSERLEYEINFVKTGPHYVWILAWAASGSDDSCHAGLDGEETPLSDNLSGWNSSYEWNNGRYQRPERAQIDIDSAGVHTLNIWVREDGLIIDKIVLTTNPDYTPQGDGPPESSRGVRLNAAALTPSPDADDVLRDSELVWIPGIYAAKHNLYWGDNFEDVNSATVPTAAGLDVNSFDPGRLEFGQTYYWRVDEVNGAPDNTLFPGDVWSFTVEPYSIPVPGSSIVATASSSSNELSTPETTINGSGLEGNDVHAITAEAMWFSASPDPDPWIQYEFEDVIQLDMMRVWNSNSGAESAIGWGIKDVQIETSVDGVTWDVLAGTTQFSRAPGSPTYNQFDEIAFNGVAAKWVRFSIQSNWGGILPSYSLSEVQFSMIPVAARSPRPTSGTGEIQPDAMVTWRAGREAAQHTVYVSADQNEVADGSAPSATSLTNSIDLNVFGLEMGETYYWRVDEVNETEATAAWAGPVWSLSIVDSLTVDDFERYNNITPDRPFQTWLDGFGYSADEFFPAGYGGNGTGAGIGHDIWSLSSPHYDGELMETNNTIAGSAQSMPFYYGNTGGVASETQRTFAIPQDWTLGGAQTLSIAFSGQAGNTGTLYVKINDAKVTYSLDAGNLAIGVWQVWNIDLTQVAGNLSSVSTMSIGVDGAGASGMILIDDMKLYAQPGEVITPVAPGSTGLLAQYSFEGNANDSSG